MIKAANAGLNYPSTMAWRDDERRAQFQAGTSGGQVTNLNPHGFHGF
jgi:hypothetical protein